jgi:hypothetical protein
VRYALDSNIRPAKFAARLLAHSKESAGVCTEVVEVRRFRVLVVPAPLTRFIVHRHDITRSRARTPRCTCYGVGADSAIGSRCI